MAFCMLCDRFTPCPVHPISLLARLTLVPPPWTAKDEKKYQSYVKRAEKYLRKAQRAYAKAHGANDAEKARQAAIERVKTKRSGRAA